MSHATNPRILKVKRLPKGKFSWRINLKIVPGDDNMGRYERYYGSRQQLPKEFFEYLEKNVQGRHLLHGVRPLKVDAGSRRRPKTYDYLLFDDAIDVMLFKLTFGHLIHQIYELEVEDQPGRGSR